MNLMGRIIGNAASIVLAVCVLAGVLVVFGSTPSQRYNCELESANVVDTTVCVLKVAL